MNDSFILERILGELTVIRKILEREEKNKSMILQKVNDENFNTKLR